MTVATRTCLSSPTRRYFYTWRSRCSAIGDNKREAFVEYISGSAPASENFNPATHREHANNSDRSPTSFKPRINLSVTSAACCDEKTNANVDRYHWRWSNYYGQYVYCQLARTTSSTCTVYVHSGCRLPSTLKFFPWTL